MTKGRHGEGVIRKVKVGKEGSTRGGGGKRERVRDAP